MAVFALTLPASAQLDNANVIVVKDKDGVVVSDAVVTYKRPPDKSSVLGVPLGDGTFLLKNLEGKVQLEIAPATLKTIAPSTVSVFIPPKQEVNRIEVRYIGSKAFARVIPMEGADLENLGINAATTNIDLNRPSKAVRPPLGPAGCIAGDGDECDTPLIATDGANAGDTSDNTGSTGDDSSCAGAGDTVDEWWCYTATCTGQAIADTCGSGFDTSLMVVAGCGFAELDCNDDTCGLQSQVSWDTTAGVQYFIRVSGFGGATGPYTLNIQCQGAGGGPCPPAGDGDECDAPILVSEGNFAGTTADNSGVDNDTSCAGGGDTIDEWYCYTASCDGLATASTCGSGFDTSLAAFSSCGGLEIVCNDDTCGLQSTISWAVTAGTNYLVRVSGFGGQTGDYVLDISCQSAGDIPDDCADAEVIACNSTITADNTFATTAPDDPGYSCHFSGPGTQGVGTLWYQFVATHDSALLSTCTSLPPADDSLIAVYDGTCGNFVELACSEDFCGLLSELVVQGLTVGNTYFIQLASFSESDRGAYELTLQCPGPEPCTVPCPPGATVENEPDCGIPSDTVNGGCNSIPPVFDSIACGETVCGTAAFDGATRDTDWYEVILTEETEITWTVEAEFDLVTFIISPGGLPTGCEAPDVSDPGLAGPCEQVSISACLPAGNHWVFAAPDFTVPIACGARYTASLSCVPCVVPPGPCENPDAGDCFMANGTPGCNIPECCDLICGLDPFCCDVEWDSICADAALDFCEVPAQGACCLPDATCQILLEEDCLAAGGAFQGDGSDCSGEPPPPGLCVPGEEDAVITINLLTDDFPGETTIQLAEKGGDIIFDAGPFLAPATLHTFEIDVCASSCYNFTIFDAFGDGICCGFGLGSYEVLLDGNVVGAGGAFGEEDTVNNIGAGCGGGALCAPGSEDATVTINLLTDDFPGETTIELTEQGGGTVLFAGPFANPGELLVFEVPVCSTSCYDFTIFDAFGDGICCGFGLGSYEVLFNGNLVGSGGEFGDSETVSNIGDGCGGGGLCAPGSEDATVTINLLTDDFPGETTIELSEKDGGVVFSAGPFANPGELLVFDVPVCSTSCYNFTIFDAFGDGICCGFGLGSYEVLFNGNLVGSGGEFGDSETVSNIGDGCGGGGLCAPGSEDATVTINLLTDDFPGETTIELSEKGGGIVFSAGPFANPGELLVFDVPVCSTSCYNFTIFDAFGDGICCGFGLGSYEVLFNGNLVGSGGEFGDSETVSNIGDGCDGGGGLCAPGSEDATVTIELLTDDFPGETTIELSEKDGGVVFSAGPFANPGELLVFDVPVCSTSCYNFTIFDAFGDGICCGFGLGSYTVFFNGNEVGSGGEFGDSDTVNNIGDGCFGDGGCVPGTEDATVTINLLTDDFPGETTIELSENGGGIVFSAGPFVDPATLHVFDIPVCSTSCYTFTIFDAFGDGICCGFGLGSYEVLFNGNLVGGGGDFDEIDVVENVGGAGCFPFQGACCVPDGSCLVTTEACCLNAGGTFVGFGTSCADDPCVILADLDIKPGSCPNSYNRNSNGVLPVALLGSDVLDASMVDISTLQISRADGVGGSIGPNEGPPGPHTIIDDTATPFDGELCDCHALNGDGVDDVNMKFNTPELVAVLELDDQPAGALVELVVTGTLTDGRNFQASDCVRLVPPGTSEFAVSVSSNLPGAWVNLTPQDMTLDAGGYAQFTRVYPKTARVTLKAPATQNGKVFKRFIVNGVLQPLGQQSLDWVVDGDATVEIRYGSVPGGGGNPAGSLDWLLDAANPIQAGGIQP